MTHEDAKLQAIKSLSIHEGLELKPYQCPAGKTTIGYGRNLEDNGITEGEAVLLLNNDLNRVISELNSNFRFFNELSTTRQAVLIDMAYNLGLGRFMTFQNMIEALEDGDYQRVVDEMLDSKWAEQVGQRAERLAISMLEDTPIIF